MSNFIKPIGTLATVYPKKKPFNAPIRDPNEGCSLEERYHALVDEAEKSTGERKKDLLEKASALFQVIQQQAEREKAVDRMHIC